MLAISVGSALNWTAYRNNGSGPVFIPGLKLSMIGLNFVASIFFMFYSDSTRRGEFRPRQSRQLPSAVDLKGRLLSFQSY